MHEVLNVAALVVPTRVARLACRGRALLSLWHYPRMVSEDKCAKKWNVPRRWVLGLIVSIVTVVFAGCGSGASRQPSTQQTRTTAALSTQSGSAPVGIAASVTGDKISVAAFDRLLASEVDSEPESQRLAPPDFTACISHHRIVSNVAVSQESVRQLKTQCESEYQRLRQEVLGRLISALWVVGEARELGVDASHGTIERLVHKTEFTYDGAREYLDAEAIRALIKRRVGRVTHARIVSWYDAHKSQFAVPETRDVRIVRARTRASALAIKREIAGGTTFASAARQLTAHDSRLQQPFHSKEGLVLGLRPGFYNEPPLNRAIFTARPHKLEGPIDIVHAFPGSFVFEVTRITRGFQKPLAEVEGSIRKRLPEVLYKKALVSFVSTWRAKWRAKTRCRPGYVIFKCRQFKGAAPSQQDPYALA
jgi:foldase protein PrsA